MAAWYEPLSARDAWFLYAERAYTPLDLSTVYVFEGVGDRDLPGAAGLRDSIAGRLHLVPRYRQRILSPPFALGHPVWVDDEHFDIDYHVQRRVLDPPGDGAQFRRLVMRLMERPLDKRRPLWELHIVEGLRGGRVGVLNRVHHAMVDGASNVDIMQLLFDAQPEPPISTPEPWTPRAAPTRLDLLKRELWNPLPAAGERPPTLGDRVRAAYVPLLGMWSLGRSAIWPSRRLFFNRPLGPRRTGRGVEVPLSDFKALKARFGCTVNDAVLAVVAEALHRWFVARGGGAPERIKVFVPVSIRVPGERSGGNRISGMVFDLPTGALDLLERLERVRVTTGDLKRSRQALAADRIAGLADWAPPTLLVLAGRIMATPQAGANLNVTNIPGPQFPLYTGGARLLEVWPFAPLYASMGLGIAVVSYDGRVFFGLTAEPTIVPDVEDFTAHLAAAAEACREVAAAS